MWIITLSVWPKIDLKSWAVSRCSWFALSGCDKPVSWRVLWVWQCLCVSGSWRRRRWPRPRPRSVRCSPTGWPRDPRRRTARPASLGRRWTAPWASPYTNHGSRGVQRCHGFSARPVVLILSSDQCHQFYRYYFWVFTCTLWLICY